MTHNNKWNDQVNQNKKFKCFIFFFTFNLGIKIYLPVSDINSPDCRPVIVALSNSDELFVYYFEEDSDMNIYIMFILLNFVQCNIGSIFISNSYFRYE